MYGLIGFGIGVAPGFPLFHTGGLYEITDAVPAVPGAPYGTQMYGVIGTRMKQAEPATDVTMFHLRPDQAYSPLFVEDELMGLPLRLLEDETQGFEFSEVSWPS
jgi:hypothetical protein